MEKNLWALKIEAELYALRSAHPMLDLSTGWMPVREIFDKIMAQIHKPGFPLFNYAQLVNDVLTIPTWDDFDQEAKKKKNEFDSAFLDRIRKIAWMLRLTDAEIVLSIQKLEARFHRQWKLVPRDWDSNLDLFIIELFPFWWDFNEIQSQLHSGIAIAKVMKK